MGGRTVVLEAQALTFGMAPVQAAQLGASLLQFVARRVSL
jgi:hypothetical protein